MTERDTPPPGSKLRRPTERELDTRLWRFAEDPQRVFGAAIADGALSEDPGDWGYADAFMYMAHSAGGAILFKDIWSRCYWAAGPFPAGIRGDAPAGGERGDGARQTRRENRE